MLQKETLCVKNRGVKTFEQEDFHIFLILFKYIYFSFSTALWKQQKILYKKFSYKSLLDVNIFYIKYLTQDSTK